MSVYKRKDRKGKVVGWRAVVRIKGYPTVCKQCDRKEEADDWEEDTRRRIKAGQFQFHRHKVQNTFSELVDCFIRSGALEHHRSAEDTKRHLEYWRGRLGEYAMVHLTTEHLAKERQFLIDTPTDKNAKRSSATVNRYIASLSSCLTYASRELRWIDENPCFNLFKLKESKGRDRILTEDEACRLLTACRESRSPYLFCIVLLAITTGMRQGEILGLRWDQVELSNQLAHIRETKNGRPRSVPLVDEIVVELQKLYQGRDPIKPLIFTSKTVFGAYDIKKVWKEALIKANIHNLRFHDMRHSFATWAARQGASNLELATAMGHKTLQMLQHYTHLEADLVRKYSQGITQNLNLEKMS